MKTEIISEINKLIDFAKQTKNSYLKNKLISIKKKLLEEWNNSDLYYEQLKQELTNVDSSGTSN
jgi:hypothetical protein